MKFTLLDAENFSLKFLVVLHRKVDEASLKKKIIEHLCVRKE